MAWDLEFKNGDLTGGIVTGDDEVIQRIRTRLFRELGEWFLNTSSGLPWYQDGKGILGSPLRDKGAVDLFIRKQALGTEGVSRILKLNSLFAAGQREYSIYMQVLLDSGKLVEQTVTVHESVFTAPGMTMSDLTKLMAQNILSLTVKPCSRSWKTGHSSARKENREKTARPRRFPLER